MAWKITSITVSAMNAKPIVREWFDGQNESVQNRFLAVMGYLVHLPANGWDRPYVGQLRRECKGLFEIVLSVNGVEHRPIGYFPRPLEFTFLAFATERDGKLDPVNVCTTALNRIGIIEASKERLREILF